MVRKLMIEKCKNIDIQNRKDNGMTIEQIKAFYSVIDDKELEKIYKEYYG